MGNQAKTILIRSAMLCAAVEAAAPAALAVTKKRPILEAVHFESDGEKLTVVATDAARLHRVVIAFSSIPLSEDGIKDCTADAGFICNVNAAALLAVCKSFKSAFKKLRFSPIVTIEQKDDDNISISSPLGTTILKNESGDYPLSHCGNYFFDGDLGALIAFNPDFIADTGKAAKAFKGSAGYEIVMHAPRDPMKPFIVSIPTGSEYIKADAVVTPLRDKDSNAYPGFNALKNSGSTSEDFKKLQELRETMEHEREVTQNTIHEMTLERDELKHQLEQKETVNPAMVASDIDERLEAALKRVEELEKKAAAAIDENNKLKCENESLKASASKAQAAAVSQGATEKQIAYIRKLGGTIPEDLTIRTASILIAQLKKGNRYNA